MSDISFSKLTWENLPARTTALSATNLNRIEKGIADSVNGVNSNSHSIAELQTRISQIANGSPTPVSTVAEMTDESAVYLYTGSETGYTAGNWYFWNGSAWTSGGQYGGAVTSTTFTEHGVPADDFAVGQALAEKADADDLTAVQTAVAGKADADDVDARFDTVEQAIEDATFDGMDMLLTEVSDAVYSGNLVDNTNVRFSGAWVFDLRMSHPVDGVYYSNPLVGTMGFANAQPYDSDGNSISFVGSTATDIKVGYSTYVYKWEISNQTSITVTSYTSLAAFNNNTPRTKTTYTLSAIPAYWIISGKAAANPATSADANFGMTAEPSETYVPYVEPVVTYSYEYADTLDEHIEEIAGSSGDVAALDTRVTSIEDALEDKADKSDLDNLDMVQIADDFSTSKTYAIGDYAVYAKKLYRCITAITTAGAWDSAKWTEISVMGDLGSRLDMLVTMQEIREDEDEPTSEIVQLINPEWITWQTVSTQYRANISQRIPLKGNGVYYGNPYRQENTDPGNGLMYPKFYNAFGELITFTKQGATETKTYFSLFTTYGCRFEISDGNILTLYVRGNEVSSVWVGDSEIAYMGEDAGKNIFFGLTEERDVGITYGGYSKTYVPYEGSAPVITHEYQYVPAMADYVQRYMQIYGTAASNSMYKRYYPDEDKTLAVNAFRYWHDRAERENRGVIRVASFNKFVSRQTMNWPVMKQELADYSVDICGFQEATNILSDGKRIEEFMLGYQFMDGSDFSFETYNFNNGTGPGKAIVSHWEVTDTDVFTLVTTDSAVQSAVRCKMTIPSGKWFSNYVDSECTLSVYSWHGVAYNGTIDGVSKTSLEIRQMEITALLAIMAQDTSDFIVVVADTNCFETGLDIQNNTHVEWEMFRTAGYTPILPGIESTVTGNVAASHFHIDGNGTAFCDACYDQIFVSSHITAEGYKVVDSNLYPVPAASNAPVSDHCMIYADLKFDFDALMQEKLIDKIGV